MKCTDDASGDDDRFNGVKVYRRDCTFVTWQLEFDPSRFDLEREESHVQQMEKEKKLLPAYIPYCHVPLEHVKPTSEKRAGTTESMRIYPHLHLR